MSVKDIGKFKAKNRISINLLAAKGKEVYICRIGGNYEKVINLMLISRNEMNHYVAIKSLSRLLTRENTKHHGKQYFCMNCLQGFAQEMGRDEHRNYCLNDESVKVEMPHKKQRVGFCDGQFQFKVPFIMYADFESLLEPIQGPENDESCGLGAHRPIRGLLQREELIITFPLVGAFTVSSHMEKSKIP